MSDSWTIFNYRCRRLWWWSIWIFSIFLPAWQLRIVTPCRSPTALYRIPRAGRLDAIYNCSTGKEYESASPPSRRCTVGYKWICPNLTPTPAKALITVCHENRVGSFARTPKGTPSHNVVSCVDFLVIKKRSIVPTEDRPLHRFCVPIASQQQQQAGRSFLDVK